MRSCWVIASMLAIVSCASAYAQPSHVDTRQQIEQMAERFSNFYNNQDAAAVASMFAKDGVRVSAGVDVVSTGPEAIKDVLTKQFKSGLTHIDLVVDQVSILGTDVALSHSANIDLPVRGKTAR